MWSNVDPCPAVLGTVHQQQQAAYCTHKLDPRCTISTQWCLVLPSRRWPMYVPAAVCKRHLCSTLIILVSCTFIESSTTKIVRTSIPYQKYNYSYCLRLCFLHCWPIDPIRPRAAAANHLLLFLLHSSRTCCCRIVSHVIFQQYRCTPSCTCTHYFKRSCDVL